MARVRLTDAARRDLLRTWVDVAISNVAAADKLYGRLEARLRILQRFPEAGPPRPSIDAEARVLVERPYLILCRLIPGGPQIVRVLHAARNVDAALFGEGLE